MNDQPTRSVHEAGDPRPARSWHATAVELTGRTDADADPATALAMLEHAAVALLHPPLAEHTAAHLALLLVDQAVAELTDIDVTAAPPMAVDTDNVPLTDVRELLTAAAALLPRCTGHDTAVLAQARATMFTRQALAALPDA
ncbi:hypothetical protein [Frankia sp. Cas4]|uniref:hypothetical protein n=1 Tax=Frankia sp. Cas4 TaxID=3073927 RepID=UPI002AD29B08|nr:hypothetical protein [Frankia sp. Cas4]